MAAVASKQIETISIYWTALLENETGLASHSPSFLGMTFVSLGKGRVGVGVGVGRAD